MYAASFVWAKVLGYMENLLTDTVISPFFDDAEVVEMTEDLLVLSTSSVYRKEFILDRCSVYIKDAMKELFHMQVEVKVFTKEELELLKQQAERKSHAHSIGSDFTFDNFIVGPSNEFAHAAASAVSKKPAQVYNPLYLYGPSGLGKTHLLYAIAGEIEQRFPDYKIVYIRAEQFTNELIQSIHSGRTQEFRDKYRSADLLLMDDVQFIAGKDSTQEEFFHTFNSLYEDHRQIVLTSDRPPSDMPRLEDRLKTRFESGLIVSIDPPDYETRMAIIQNKALSLGMEMPNDVCSYIADNITTNIRQIEGTVKKIKAYAELTGMTINVPNVSRAIADMYKGKADTLPTPSLIISEVSRYYNIDENTIRGPLKNKSTAEARQMAMYLIRTLTKMSFPDIAREFGRDHSTVLHSVNKIDDLIVDASHPLNNTIRDITSNINNRL